MSIQQAAAIIRQLQGEAKSDLFTFFVDYFDFPTTTISPMMTDFAVLCGFPIACNVSIIPDNRACNN